VNVIDVSHTDFDPVDANEEAADIEVGPFVPEPDDEIVEAGDPPINPDPIDEEGAVPFAGKQKNKPSKPPQPASPAKPCPKRSATLSPKGLTFVIHVSKHFGGAAVKQLKKVRSLIRARDIFMIEQKEAAAHELRQVFPCNPIHYIAYPHEMGNAFGNKDFIDGIAVDWEGGKVWSQGQGWTIDRLDDYAKKIRQAGLIPSVVPYWPGSFNDGHIVKASHMKFELSQIQNHCVASANSFGAAAKSQVHNFQKNGLSARDIGFEISLNSFDHADNHTGVDRSAACTRKAYGKGARAIYLYGNGHPHLDDYFIKIAKMGIRGKH
jgi:hypothetical protein